MEKNEQFKCVYSKDGNMRFLVPLDAPDIVNFIYQPERSKREDIEDLKHSFVTVGCTDHRYCTKCGEEDHVIKAKMMRCSEHSGN